MKIKIGKHLAKLTNKVKCKVSEEKCMTSSMKANSKTMSIMDGDDILTIKEPTGVSMTKVSEMEKENGWVSMDKYKKVIGLKVCLNDMY